MATGSTIPSVGLGWPGGELEKLGRFGGGTRRIVAPSKRPGIFGYRTPSPPPGRKPNALLIGDGDSTTGESWDRRAISLSSLAFSLSAPSRSPEDDSVLMVVTEA